MNGGRRLSPQEIADILRERIRAGELRAGDRLPTQAELAEEFGVAPCRRPARAQGAKNGRCHPKRLPRLDGVPLK
ncbi:hypothetical protein SGRIM128S_04358 [Streptomyces griseomycini]